MDTRRRLLFHGMLLLLLGLMTGAFVPVATTPRLALSAHVGGVMNGMLLLLFGLLWGEIVLTEREERAAYALALYAMYGVWAATLLGALFGTSRANPIAGAGHVGTAWQETLVSVLLTSGAIAAVAVVGMLLHGLRRAAHPPT